MLAIEYCILFQSLAVLGKNDFWWQLVLDEGILSESGFWCLVNEVVESRVLNSRWSSKWRSTLLWMNVNDHLKTFDLLHLRSSRWLCEWSAKGLWKGLKLRKALPLTAWYKLRAHCTVFEFWGISVLFNLTRYNWPHSFSCAARCLERQISCHNKRYIQLSQSRPCTGEVQTRHEYWNLYVTMLWLYHVVESCRCKHGGKRIPTTAYVNFINAVLSFTVGSIFSLTGICFRMKFQTIFPQNRCLNSWYIQMHIFINTDIILIVCSHKILLFNSNYHLVIDRNNLDNISTILLAI